MSAVIPRNRPFAPGGRPPDDHSQPHAGGETLRDERQQDDPEANPRASDAGHGRRRALDWLADNLRWKRTLDVLRAQRSGHELDSPPEH